MVGMIDERDQRRIRDVVNTYWDTQVRTPEFAALFAGKEIGHRIADYVDEHTTRLLAEHFPTQQEEDSRGRSRARSMGDVWLQSNGMYNPVNVKAGEAGKNGQPNLVSLNKLLIALLKRHIDSYYLLIVKMRLNTRNASESVLESELEPGRITPNVYLVDMLDYLDYVAFDAGPGQAMLREAKFYLDVDDGVLPPHRSMSEKVTQLVDMLEDGHKRLITNRAKRIAVLRKMVTAYTSQGTHVVDQGDLRLG